jgi:hypothetical protein
MPEAASTQSATQPTTTTTTLPVQRLRRLGNFEQAAQEQGCTQKTVRNHLARGHFNAYRMRGVRGVLLDLDEVDQAMRDMPKKYWSGRARYGPNAVIIDIPVQPIIVNEQRSQAGGDR